MFCEKIHKRGAGWCIHLESRHLRISVFFRTAAFIREMAGYEPWGGRRDPKLQFRKATFATQSIDRGRRLSAIGLAGFFEGQLVPELFHLLNHGRDPGNHSGNGKLSTIWARLAHGRGPNAGLCAFCVLVQKSRHGVGGGRLQDFYWHQVLAGQARTPLQERL